MTDPSQPFINEASQQERRDLLREHLRARQQGTTYHQFGSVDAEEPQGRFAKITPMNVVGSKPVVQYPGDVPAWVTDRGPDELPLGYSVEDHEATGEIFEQQASLGRLPVDDANGEPKDAQNVAPSARPFSISAAAPEPHAAEGAARSGGVSPSSPSSAPLTPSSKTNFRRRI